MRSAVKPFPFLRLPAELRLQVYSYIVPRDGFISLSGQTVYSLCCGTFGDHYKTPAADLTSLRVSRQIYTEVRKYFFDNRTLLVKTTRDNGQMELSTLAQCYKKVARMRGETRAGFKRLEIMVDYHSPASAHGTISVDGIERSPLREMMDLLANLDVVLVSFPDRLTKGAMANSRAALWLRRVPAKDGRRELEWLVDQIPETMALQWDFTDFDDAPCIKAIAKKMERRGGEIKFGKSLAEVR